MEAVDPVFQAKMLDMLKQTGRPEMVVGWYHSHPGFGCWLSGQTLLSCHVMSRAERCTINAHAHCLCELKTPERRSMECKKMSSQQRQSKVFDLKELSPTEYAMLSCGVLAGVDINTQQSFEALSERAVAVVVDPIQSVKGKVCFRARPSFLG